MNETGQLNTRVVANERKVATREAILGMNDLKIVPVVVPEWDNLTVYVRALSAKGVEEFADTVRPSGQGVDIDIINIRAKLVSLTACNEDGVLLFGPDDIDALGERNANAMMRLYVVAQSLSGLGEDTVEEMARSLQSGHSGDSSSA